MQSAAPFNSVMHTPVVVGRCVACVCAKKCVPHNRTTCRFPFSRDYRGSCLRAPWFPRVFFIFYCPVLFFVALTSLIYLDREKCKQTTTTPCCQHIATLSSFKREHRVHESTRRQKAAGSSPTIFPKFGRSWRRQEGRAVSGVFTRSHVFHRHGSFAYC